MERKNQAIMGTVLTYTTAITVVVIKNLDNRIYT